MPTADGRFRGITVSGEAWDRVFGKPSPVLVCPKHGPQTAWPHESHSSIAICELCGQDLDKPAHEALRTEYERHLHTIGPDSHATFYARLLGR